MFEKIYLFSELAPAQHETLIEHSIIRNYPKNTILINEGDDTDTLYIIQEGKVKVFVSDEDGKEIILNILGPGEYFGELALLDNAPRSASVITSEPTKVAVISRTEFNTVMEKHPDISANLLKAMVQRIRTLTENVKSLALMDVYGRIARVLLEMATEDGDVMVINQKLTHQEIANMVGSSREMVSRIMKDLSRGEYITTEKDRMIINERLPKHW